MGVFFGRLKAEGVGSAFEVSQPFPLPRGWSETPALPFVRAVIPHTRSLAFSPSLPAVCSPPVSILDSLVQAPHSTQHPGSLLSRTLCARTRFESDPSVRSPLCWALAVERGLAPGPPRPPAESRHCPRAPRALSIHSAWLLSLIIKLAVIF